jgi:hypothetical protein
MRDQQNKPQRGTAAALRLDAGCCYIALLVPTGGDQSQQLVIQLLRFLIQHIGEDALRNGFRARARLCQPFLLALLVPLLVDQCVQVVGHHPE